MKARVAEGCTVEDARWRASEHFGAMEGKCKDAWDYYRPASAWIDQRMTTDFGKVAGPDFLETIYHQIYADPADRSFQRMNSRLLDQLGLSHLSAAGG